MNHISNQRRGYGITQKGPKLVGFSNPPALSAKVHAFGFKRAGMSFRPCIKAHLLLRDAFLQ